MKAGMKLTELAAELERQHGAKHDYKAPVEKIAMRATPDDRGIELEIAGVDSFEPTALFHDQIGQFAKIPGPYYDRMLQDSPELLAANVNHWLEKQSKDVRLVRTLDGKARAFLSDRYRTIDNHDIGSTVLPILLDENAGLDLRIESCAITERKMYIKAVSQKVVGTVVGEHVQSGIVISNSEVGLHSFKVEPLVFILSCTNGAIMPDAGMRRYHIGRIGGEVDTAIEVFADDTRKADDRALMLKLRDVVRASFNEVRFRELTKHLTLTARMAIAKPIEEAVATVVEVFDIADKHQSGILDALARGGDLTQWGLSNAVTLYAQNDSLNYDEATDLERIGGELLTLTAPKWREIAIAA